MGNLFRDLGVIGPGKKQQINMDNFSGKFVRSDIISCSRRTDIPAFNVPWLVDKIKQGYVDVVNPFNKKIVSRVSLLSQDVSAWVWWSKNFQHWIDQYQKTPDLFKQYPVHIFNFTINSNSELESGLKIPLDDRINQARWLINEFGIKSLQWRFDPIVFYRKKEGDSFSEEIYNNLNDFEYILNKLANFGADSVIFSFASIYPKVANRMIKRGKKIINPSKSEKQRILDEMSLLCEKRGVQMYACCQPEWVGYGNIKKSHCVDGEKINSLLNHKIRITSDKGQRQNCGCNKSRDIGGYSGIFRCKHNCDYCYANPTKT